MAANLTLGNFLGVDAVNSFGAGTFQLRSNEGYTYTKVELGKEVNAIVSILSVSGVLFSLVTSIALKTHKHAVGKMVIGLCLMDLMLNGALIFDFGDIYDISLCQLQTFFIYCGYGGSLAWTCCFAHSLWYSLNIGEAIIKDSLFKIYAWISSAAALVIGAVAVFTRFRQIDDGLKICKHVHGSNGYLADIGDFLVLVSPAVISILICSICYILVIKKLKDWGARMYLELLLYPIILLICYCPLAILAVYTRYSGYQPSETLYAICNGLFSAQGFLNAFAYGLSRKVVLGWMCKCCLRKKPQRVGIDSDLSEPENIGSRLMDPGQATDSLISQAS